MFGHELGEVSCLSQGLAECSPRSGTCEEMPSSQSAICPFYEI